jgi:hypothetical protein
MLDLEAEPQKKKDTLRLRRVVILFLNFSYEFVIYFEGQKTTKEFQTTQLQWHCQFQSQMSVICYCYYYFYY